jgi:hypothetical protein
LQKNIENKNLRSKLPFAVKRAVNMGGLCELLWREEAGRVQEKYSTSYYDLSYPGLILKISLERKLSYHLVQVRNLGYSGTVCTAVHHL